MGVYALLDGSILGHPLRHQVVHVGQGVAQVGQYLSAVSVRLCFAHLNHVRISEGVSKAVKFSVSV